ncbi:MAG TPA: PTS sugar transporter subunit IIC [Symbiobacteriaceae bacterium]
MEITVIQAALIAFFTYLGSLGSALFFGHSGGWYVFGRPLIAGAVVGIILGDVPTGIMMGAAIQALYIGVLAVGGTIPADAAFAGYLGTALAMAAGASTEVAIALAVPFGMVGQAAWQILSVGNAAWAHYADRLAEKGDLDGVTRIDYLAQSGAFLLRFIPAFLIVYYGSAFADSLLAAIPPLVSQMLSVLGNMLPAVGLAILLKQTANRDWLLSAFLLGYALVAYLKLSVVAVAVLAAVVAVFHYQYRFARQGED